MKKKPNNILKTQSNTQHSFKCEDETGERKFLKTAL